MCQLMPEQLMEPYSKIGTLTVCQELRLLNLRQSAARRQVGFSVDLGKVLCIIRSINRHRNFTLVAQRGVHIALREEEDLGRHDRGQPLSHG